MDSNVRVATYVHVQEPWTEVGQKRSAAGQGGLHLFSLLSAIGSYDSFQAEQVHKITNVFTQNGQKYELE